MKHAALLLSGLVFLGLRAQPAQAAFQTPDARRLRARRSLDRFRLQHARRLGALFRNFRRVQLHHAHQFRPDGTVALDAPWMASATATYRIAGGTLTIDYCDRNGKRTSSSDHAISPDGKRLGELVKVTP